MKQIAKIAQKNERLKTQALWHCSVCIETHSPHIIILLEKILLSSIPFSSADCRNLFSIYEHNISSVVTRYWYETEDFSLKKNVSI